MRVMPNLTADQRRAARAAAMRFSRRATPEADLLAELNERMNAVARYQADLDAGDFADGDSDQLHGGIAYERFHIEAIVAELEARERARAYGHRSAGGLAESDLPARFAAVRAIDSADVISTLTGQDGARSGDRWRFSCPFHADATPSLTAYPGERGWYCFSCGAGGDAVRFIMEARSVGAVEALRLLEAGALGARGVA
jgi:hypothetical protein